jgi:hypothetical protein
MPIGGKIIGVRRRRLGKFSRRNNIDVDDNRTGAAPATVLAIA